MSSFVMCLSSYQTLLEIVAVRFFLFSLYAHPRNCDMAAVSLYSALHRNGLSITQRLLI